MAAKRKTHTDEQISIRAYAQVIGVDEKTVRKARDAGLLQDGFDFETGKIIPSLANEAWGNAQKTVRKKPGVSSNRLIEKLSGFEDFDGKAGADLDADESALSESDWLIR